MINIEDEHLDTHNPSLIEEEEEVFVNPTGNGIGAQQGHDAEVTMLFEEARDKLAKVEANAIKQKSQIVADLAKSLEEKKIPLDTICMEIINQLRGQVSATFIRQYLQEKYKQKTRVENAKKKQKQKPGIESKTDEKLATVTLLNKEDNDNKKKVMVAEIGGSGPTLIHEDDEDSEDEQAPMYSESDNTKVTEAPISQQLQQEQPSIFEPEASPQDQHLDRVGPDGTPEDSSQMVAAGGTTVSAASPNYNSISDKPDIDDGYILPFEISFLCSDIRRQMIPLYKKNGDNEKLWFSISIDIRTRKVVSWNIGRIGQTAN
jgi:hypothetical protein